MIEPKTILTQISQLTADLIGISLCNDQMFPAMHELADNYVELDFGGKTNISFVLKNRPYHEIYNELERTKAYNLKMIDGAIIQILYRFKESQIESHRLAFFPSPYLEEYQNNPEIYENDEIYADIIMRNIVPFPIRFDFDIRENVAKTIEHPMSHLTLGQYQNCRIPVSAPLTPYLFLCFILRNFYNTAFNKLNNKITNYSDLFNETIEEPEKSIIHLSLPN